MPNRREFVKSGLAAWALGMLRRTGFAAGSPHPASAVVPPELAASRPFLQIPTNPESIMVQGLPFAEGWFGDPFRQDEIPFHGVETNYPGGSPPAPSEEVEVAIVGGGLSGLTTAYLLRHRKPVLFELRSRFGGVSQGEEWSGTRYSYGGAYFIWPDEGSFLEQFYHELGLDHAYRLSDGGVDPMELNGVIRDDFWTGAGLPPQEVQAFQEYAAIVEYYAENYPEIPLIEGKDNQWILELDQLTLKQHLEQQMTVPIPRLLADGIQSYCYSSFDAGWDEISAAAGWNFIAAEEFGRWVCPGGNAYVTDLLWQKLVHEYSTPASNNYLDRLRPNTRVVEVRLADDDKALVIYKDQQNNFKSLLARRVVMACSKHICKYMLPDAPILDPMKQNGLASIITNPYVVVNVLLHAPIERDFYDVFLLRDGNFPLSEAEVSKNSNVVDMLNGSFARHGNAARNVLTLYWPLPWGHAVFTIILDDVAWMNYANRVAPQIRTMLNLLNVPEAAVQQVRMTRWGHAMPIAYPRFIADGWAHHARRPFADRIYFVNQDNWALPAFETCVLEAQTYAAEIDASL